jgi:hypothetical protein
MSSLHDLIKKIQVAKVDLQSYVYYSKDTGKIHKISSSNVPDNDYEIIKLSNEEVRPILTGEKRTEEFIIRYDISAKQVILKEIKYDDSNDTASTMCYCIPVNNKTAPDIIICQDTVNKVWKIIINSTIKKVLTSTTINTDYILYFSITSKNDPNILYRSLEFTVSNLVDTDGLTIPFKYDIESSFDDVSIYTSKYFDSYLHEVI